MWFQVFRPETFDGIRIISNYYTIEQCIGSKDPTPQDYSKWEFAQYCRPERSIL